MTEEAILKCLDILQSNISKSYFAQNVSYCEMRALVECKKIIEAIQQYRTIGTVEECREARERQKPKKPVKDEYNHAGCSNCGWVVCKDEWGGRYLPHCENCGQAIDWSE